MSRQPILQQYYTRGRQGIFRSNEGYDTVAKSPGLDNTFIKKTLHPFCVYDAPRQLQERAETYLALYPEALVCFRAESGEMVIGKSVYVGADFTGQRNTFFSHNYVIPAERRDEFIKEPARIFGLRAFARQHDEAAGKELPELESLPYQAGMPDDRKRLLRLLGIDERLFKQLLYAVMVSLSAKKKVFISLDGDVGEAAASAHRLLEVLYGCLPYEMRRHFGFLTYSNEPQSKKFIHVMCVETGSIRPGSGQHDKDFLFDIANRRIVNADPLEGEHEYLDFAWTYLNEPQILTSFHDFADEVLAGADRDAGLRVSTYYELCALYLIEKGQMAGYQRNQAGIWQVLLNYLGQDGLVNKKRLQDLLRVLFREEANALAAKNIPSAEVVRLISASCRMSGQESYQKEVLTYLMDVLLKAKVSRQNGYVTLVYKHIRGQRELFGSLMETVFGYPQIVKPLFEEYLAEVLAPITRIDPLLKEIEFWAAAASQALRNPFFLSATTQKMLSLLAGDRKKVDTAVQVHSFFATFSGSRSYVEKLLNELDKFLLKQISVDKLSKEDIQKLNALLAEKPQSFVGELDWESRQKHDLLQNVASLEGQGGVPLPADFFQGWDERDVAIQQKLIRTMLEGQLDHDDSFAKAALVFYNPDERGQESFRFAELLAFVHANGGDGLVFSFIRWTMTQRMFFAGKQLLPAYRQALKQYFGEEKGSRLRTKAGRSQWAAIRNADFRHLLEEVRYETAHPLRKLFRKKTMLIVGLAIVVTAGAASVFLLAGPNVLPSAAPLPADNEAGKQSPGSDSEGAQQPAKPVEFVPVYKLMLDPQIVPVDSAVPFKQTSESEQVTDQPAEQSNP